MALCSALKITDDGGTVTERYSNVVVNALNLEVADDYGKLTADLLGGFPDASTLSESFTQPTEFAYSDYTATFGTSFSNAAGSAASSTLTSDATAPADGATIVIGSDLHVQNDPHEQRQHPLTRC